MDELARVLQITAGLVKNPKYYVVVYPHEVICTKFT
jgi:hypothetical protein